MAEWTLRSATIADCDRLALIGAATFLETFAGQLDGDAIIAHCRDQHSASIYRRYLEGGASAWLVELQPGGAPIGFALLAEAELPGSRSNDQELKRIYCLSRFHGQGLGAALLAKVVEAARSKAAERLLLGVYVANDKAQAFYRRKGFSPLATRLFQVGKNYYEDVVFSLPLS
jgi:GNAT superfamily N-acetyltransferase